MKEGLSLVFNKNLHLIVHTIPGFVSSPTIIMPPPCFLDVFPMEIIDNIVDQLCRPPGHRTSILQPCHTCIRVACLCYNATELAILARTCRLLNTLATPRLYYFPGVVSSDQGFLLARTLITRPDLARLVKVLHLDELEGITTDVPEEVTEAYMARFHVIDPDSNRPTDPKLAWDYMKRDWDYLTPIGLLTSLCPDIESFQSDDLFLPDDRLPFWTPGGLNCSKLKTVSIRHWDTEMGFDLIDFEPLLSGARDSLCSIQGHMMSGCSETGADDNLANTTERTGRLVAVTRIALTYSGLSADSLSDLLQLCPNVQELEYETGGAIVNMEEDQFGPADVAEIVIRILDGHGNADGEKCKPLTSLKRVLIDFRDGDDHWMDNWGTEADAAVRALAERGIEFICLPFNQRL